MLEIAGYIVITLIILIFLCAGFHEVIKCYVEGNDNGGPEWYVKPNGKAATTSEEVFTSEKGKRLLNKYAAWRVDSNIKAGTTSEKIVNSQKGQELLAKYSQLGITVHRAFDKGSPECEDYSFGLPEVTECPPMPPVKPVRKGSNPEPSEPRPKAPPNPPRINSEEGEESKVGYPTVDTQPSSNRRLEAMWNPTEEDLDRCVQECSKALDNQINKVGCNIKMCGMSSWCEDCGLTWDTNDVDPPLCEKAFLMVDMDKPNEVLYNGDMETDQFFKFGNALIKSGELKRGQWLIMNYSDGGTTGFNKRKEKVKNTVDIDTLVEEFCEDPEFKNEYEKAKEYIRSVILSKVEGDYTQEDFERNINLCDEVEQIRKDIRSKLHACATNCVPVNRGTPDKYTQEASEQMTVGNLEKAVKDEIKRMEDWK